MNIHVDYFGWFWHERLPMNVWSRLEKKNWTYQTSREWLEDMDEFGSNPIQGWRYEYSALHILLDAGIELRCGDTIVTRENLIDVTREAIKRSRETNSEQSMSKLRNHLFS